MSEKAVLLDSINPAAEKSFVDSGLEVVHFPKSVTVEEFEAVIADASLLGVRSGPEVPGSVIKAGISLEAIGCFCVGTNHVDRETANDQGVAIFNSVHENTRSVAEHVIGSTFSLLRRASEHNLEMHGGTWTKTDESSYEVRGKTMGIVGYGAIGGQVSNLAESVGMDVVYFDPAPQIPPQGRAKRIEDFDAFLGTADVITLHVPGGARTRNMINAKTIAQMKPGSYIINAARGEVVDYEAVAEALESGQLGGVAVDVYANEPSKKGDPFDHVLRGMGKALLTPHIAGSTIEAQSDIGEKIAQKLAGYLATGNSAGSVNLPHLSLGNLRPDTSRLLNIHTNKPGALAEITSLIAEENLNVVHTEQDVRGDIGYVAFDIDGSVSEDTLEALADMEVTHHARVLTN